jgi:CheY-like chemotaxis protein
MLTGNSQVVLVVEDEIFIRMAAIAALEDAGFLVLEAADCCEALDIILRHPEIGVLLIDVCMPGGLALVARVRRDHPEIYSIAVSANSSATEAGNVGGGAFLAKPYLDQTMVQTVRGSSWRS